VADTPTIRRYMARIKKGDVAFHLTVLIVFLIALSVGALYVVVVWALFHLVGLFTNLSFLFFSWRLAGTSSLRRTIIWDGGCASFW